MDVMSSLKGKYAVITGSTQGLGEATARLFARRGAAGVVITGRRADRGNTIAKDITSATCRAVFVAADLAEVADCRRLISSADEAFGSVDVLVNAAALTERGSI